MFHKLLKGLAPFAALAMGAALSGCGDMDLTINGKEGVPLDELDMSGAAPTELVVAANATVIVSEGDTLDITVEDDPENALRFVLDEETLGVTRDPNLKIEDGKATVRVTMPALTSIVIAGSGSVESATMASNPEIAIGGSGSVSVAQFEAEKLEISIGGSGNVTGAGSASRVEVNIGGSGNVDLSGLTTDKAEVSIGGSGNVMLRSDGEVEANLAGAGDVQVTGSAKCTVNSFGSGKLTCSPADDADDAKDEREPALTDES
ncbi:head GIN domain-containing protein [Erythrobacter sp. THAF29]|uniref:head GIN domain-containing protein n=1 Tax=Erythrobacter sp. THAF29 TaxID=2587851 RepID=UPI0012690483|nr:head GIN domain-containing protein [Erythrobacter sp. THAF29]QFT76354.1 hypothetical protein FIU90_02245 [Erythrobacter sp. THAF29]